jgi:hypothetical protein
VTPSTKLRRAIVVLLAGGSLAVGVPAALAATGGNDTPAGAGGSGQTLEQFIQDQQGTPGRDDCPERDGSQGGSSAPDASTDPAPSV